METELVNEFGEMRPMTVNDTSRMMIEEMKPKYEKGTTQEMQNIELMETRDMTGSMESVESGAGSMRSIEVIEVMEKSIEGSQEEDFEQVNPENQLARGSHQDEEGLQEVGLQDQLATESHQNEESFEEMNPQEDQMEIIQNEEIEQILQEVKNEECFAEFKENLMRQNVLTIATKADHQVYLQDLNRILDICFTEQGGAFLQIVSYLEDFINVFKNWTREDIEAQRTALYNSLFIIKFIMKESLTLSPSETALVKLMEEAYDWREKNFDYC